MTHSTQSVVTHCTLEHEGQLTEASVVQLHDQVELAHEQRIVGTPLDLLGQRLEVRVLGLILQVPIELHHTLALFQNGILGGLTL